MTDKLWPMGVSDGLILPCSVCGEQTNIDYTVDDEYWRQVVPQHHRRNVVCIGCFEVMASDLFGEIQPGLILRIQIVGAGRTAIFNPVVVVDHLTGSIMLNQ